MNIEDPQVIQAAISQIDQALATRLEQFRTAVDEIVQGGTGKLQETVRGACLNIQATTDTTILNAEQAQKTFAPVLAELSKWRELLERLDLSPKS